MERAIDPRVVVTPREARRFSREVAERKLDAPGGALDAAIESMARSPGERAALLSAFSDARSKLESLGDEIGDATDSPGDANASLLQSALTEFAMGRELDALPTGGLEARFDSSDIAGWLAPFWRMAQERANGPHPFPTLPLAPDDMPDRARFALLGDWGSGLYGASKCARSVEGDADGFTHLVHLGDIYYSGSSAEVKGRFLSLWPRVSGAVSRACNGNHEMYSGGGAYFGELLPALGQSASCFAFRNAAWLVVGLDTAYVDHDIGAMQAAWVESLVADAAKRRLVLLSHHQPYSRLAAQGPRLVAALGELLTAGRVFAWYWAHEHRCAVYEPHATWGVHGRCLGHGGMPEYTAKLARFPRETGLRDSAWRVLDAAPGVPRSVVLDGPNTEMGADAARFLAHGYGALRFDGPHLEETIFSASGTPVYRKRLA